MNVFDIDPNTQYWVVRAGAKAISYNQFLSSGCVALGHIDNVDFESEGVITKDDLEFLEKKINALNSKKELPEDTPQMSARLGQIRHFINDFNVGDTVFTLSKSEIAIGTIISDAFIDSTPLFSLNGKGEKVESKQALILRRKVKWEKRKLRITLPSPISKSLGAQKTVFSLEVHQELLKHWLYGIYIEGNELHFTTEINQTSDIAQFHLSEFQRIIQKLELFSLIEDLDERTLDPDVIDEMYYRYGGQNIFTLSNKSIFTSPGHSWGKIFGERATLILFAALMAGCMGESVNPLDSSDKEILRNKQLELTEAISYINSTTTLESHKSHLEAAISKPNKDRFTLDKAEVSNPISRAKVSPIVDNDSALGNENSVSSTEIDDRYEDFPEISQNGDTGV
ncbi:hypothetical protein [Pseudoalteromonas sp. 2CM28B]|uniref:hypothetical protein n=1 Tax=Pseudoalteromonas sp. 2CM28B TaxID=2929851 RepID=UPI0020BDCE91|nr:hypothetical protein [Pseudoalteromonas sp. 2CM28B]MCK8132948.1 hypothetical protein [Pseudoalteromonas sp. 2CM28B]